MSFHSTEIFSSFLKKYLTKPVSSCIIYCVSSANGRSHLLYTEMYSRGRRGAPAKGVGRVNRRESSNLSISAKEKALLWQCFFFWRRKRFEHERPREGTSLLLAVRGGGRRVSEQIYICEVRRRVAAGRDLSVSSPHSSFLPLFRPYLPPIRPRCPCLCTHIVPTSYNIM